MRTMLVAVLTDFIVWYITTNCCLLKGAKYMEFIRKVLIFTILKQIKENKKIVENHVQAKQF